MRHRLARRLQSLWNRRPRAPQPERVELGDVKARLEHYLRAIYGRTVRIEAIGGDVPGATRRGVSRRRGRANAARSSESDGDVIRLPAALVPSGDGSSAFEQYRCLAVEHAERLARATADHARALGSDLERDLFELAEAVSIDHAIAATQPGLGRSVAAGRQFAIRQRHAGGAGTSLEREVERLAHSALSAPAGAPDATVPVEPRAADSVAWARRTAAELTRGATERAVARYRRIAPLGLWGTAIVGAPAGRAAAIVNDAPTAAPPPTEQPRPGSKHRLPSAGTPDQVVAREQDAGNEGAQRAGAAPSASSPAPNAPPADDATGAETDEPSGNGPAGMPDASDRETRVARRASDVPGGEEFRYPEWDLYAKGYHRDESVVRVSTPTPAGDMQSAAIDPRHSALVRQVRERFAQLRAHRQRLHRQPSGDELDLEAWVTALGDRAAGHNPDDRLYATVRATRRAIAILLLIDVSASTRTRIDAEHRVIDVERLAALLAAEAFNALGDAWSIIAFSSDGRADVRVQEIKRFSETSSALTELRLRALEPENATRLGAAVRHATAVLALRPESHRLLLVLSDGRPNDRDGYVDEDYAVEDSRRAVAEARAAGVTPYCITVDPEEPQEYMGHIFGDAGYRALSATAHLPEVLLQAVQGLLRR